jgi:phosphate-selective porin OprO and OprP
MPRGDTVYKKLILHLYPYWFFFIISGLFFPVMAESSPSGPTAPAVLLPIAASGIDVVIGGLFQADYRYYTESERADNRFMIRRAQVELTSQIRPWLKVNLEYEFKNDTIDHLQDTFAEISFGSHAARIGHFKKPFGLEQQSPDAGICFVERSMGENLSPGRDVGLMLHGAFSKNRLHYAAGLFNADGDNVGNRSDGRDEPEIIGRLVLAPFADSDMEYLQHLQFGGSGSFARINLSMLDVKVKTTGMVDTSRNIYVLSNNTKFGVLQAADTRWRLGAEAAWAWRSMALQGEYIRLTYTDLKPVGNPAMNADFKSWYVNALYFFTGETPSFSGGVLQPIAPRRPFDPATGGFGAWGIAIRYARFLGDEQWINPAAFVSVEKADALTLAVNWILTPMHKIVLDYTCTDLSDPIRVRVHPDGAIDYIDKENVVTIRYTIDI